jgi:hypothetical protein
VTINEAQSDKELATPWYSDQVLPFDITIAGANEYGAGAACKIFGVEILNEGWGTSIDDAVSEMQATFVARAVEPMQAVITGTPSLIGGDVIRPGLSLPPNIKLSRTRRSRRSRMVRARHSARGERSASRGECPG